MTGAFNRPVTRARTRPTTKAITELGFGRAFNPTTRFAAGQQGVWYDPSDLSTLFQDAAGTVPVTTAGQTVKRMNDKSGRGNHVTNASAGWTLQNDGTNNYVQTDGVFRLETAASFAWGSDKLSIFAAIKSDTGGLSKTFGEFGSIATQTAAWETTTQGGGILLYRRGSGAFGARGTNDVGTATVVMGITADLAGATQATENPYVRVDGVQGSLTDYGTADTGSGNFGSYLFRLGGQSTFFTGRIYQYIAVAAASTLEQLQDGERWCGQKSGVSLPFSAAPGPVFLDTGAQPDQGSYLLTSAFAHADYQTTATAAFVAGHSTLSAFPNYAKIGVFVDGVFNQSVAAPADGAFKLYVNLPAGNKLVSFRNSLQSAPAQTFPQSGTFFTGVEANAPMTASTPAPTNRVLVYGDSIAVGANAITPATEAWSMGVRAAYAPDSIAAEGFGYRSLYMDAFDATARAAFVAKIAAYAPARIWLAIGTNDYGLNKWSAANFGTAYAALLDDLHAALPSATIFAQTPIVRTSEVANSFGDTLGAYRTQIATAQSTRSGWCTLKDGTAILTTGDLDDGVHPTTAGHVIYRDYVKTALGIA